MFKTNAITVGGKKPAPQAAASAATPTVQAPPPQNIDEGANRASSMQRMSGLQSAGAAGASGNDQGLGIASVLSGVDPNLGKNLSARTG